MISARDNMHRTGCEACENANQHFISGQMSIVHDHFNGK
tara:strand:- start:964 stop:1080 length:117 start_codon:yes stop_codon:yes gene_type:complete